jgi:hypothetical protein
MEVLANVVSQHRLAILGAENEMEVDPGKGLGHEED